MGRPEVACRSFVRVCFLSSAFCLLLFVWADFVFCRLLFVWAHFAFCLKVSFAFAAAAVF